MLKRNKLMLLFIACLMSPTVLAHANHGADFASGGLLLGALHPVLGIDHLLTLFFLGGIGASLGAKLGRALILLVVFALVLGFVSGHAGWHFISVKFVGGITTEILILISMYVSAFIVAAQLVFKRVLSKRYEGVSTLALVCSTGFSYVHGLVHGFEIPAEATVPGFGIGFMFSSFIILSLGFALYRKLSVLVYKAA